MGGSNGKIRTELSAPEERTFYDLSVIPSKALFTPATEDITG
jgi:hypothetical protein